MLLAVEEKKSPKHALILSERLKEARNKKGISLRKTVFELNKIGISCGVSTIQGYEADEHKVNYRQPSLFMIKELAKLYGCSMDYLFGMTNEFYRPSNDLLVQLTEQDELLWNGKAIDQPERIMIKSKVNQIMAL